MNSDQILHHITQLLYISCCCFLCTDLVVFAGEYASEYYQNCSKRFVTWADN